MTPTQVKKLIDNRNKRFTLAVEELAIDSLQTPRDIELAIL